MPVSVIEYRDGEQITEAVRAINADGKRAAEAIRRAGLTWVDTKPLRLSLPMGGEVSEVEVMPFDCAIDVRVLGTDIPAGRHFAWAVDGKPSDCGVKRGGWSLCEAVEDESGGVGLYAYIADGVARKCELPPIHVSVSLYVAAIADKLGIPQGGTPSDDPISQAITETLTAPYHEEISAAEPEAEEGQTDDATSERTAPLKRVAFIAEPCDKLSHEIRKGNPALYKVEGAKLKVNSRTHATISASIGHYTKGYDDVSTAMREAAKRYRMDSVDWEIMKVIASLYRAGNAEMPMPSIARHIYTDYQRKERIGEVSSRVETMLFVPVNLDWREQAAEYDMHDPITKQPMTYEDFEPISTHTRLLKGDIVSKRDSHGNLVDVFVAESMPTIVEHALAIGQCAEVPVEVRDLPPIRSDGRQRKRLMSEYCIMKNNVIGYVYQLRKDDEKAGRRKRSEKGLTTYRLYETFFPSGITDAKRRRRAIDVIEDTLRMLWDQGIIYGFSPRTEGQGGRRTGVEVFLRKPKERHTVSMGEITFSTKSSPKRSA